MVISPARWAPDGRQVVYIRHPRDPDAAGELVLLERATGRKTVLMSGAQLAVVSAPAWSPSGTDGRRGR